MTFRRSNKKQNFAPTRGLCIASEPETWTAFATLAGVPNDSLEGAQFLADQNSWLRTVRRPGDPGDLSKPEMLVDAVRAITAHPLTTDTAGAHLHRH